MVARRGARGKGRKALDTGPRTSSPEPIYRQILAQVKHAAARGVLEAGDVLPSVRELAQELVVNPNTVMHAYAELEREGIVVTRRGLGTFVAEGRDVLSAAEKERILTAAVDRLLTEAAHLGVGEEDLVEILRRRAAAFRLPAQKRSETEGRR